MANALQDPGVYSPDSDEDRDFAHVDLGPGHNQPSGDPEDPRGPGPDNLQQAEAAAGDTGPESDDAERASSPERLRDQEASGAGETTGTADDESMYRDGDDQEGRLAALRGRTQNARSKLQGFSNKALKNKWLVGSIGAGSTLVIGAAIILALVIGGYKVVDFAEHVAAYQFARVTGQMAEDTASIDAEKVGLEVAANPDNAAGNRALATLKATYTSSTGKASELWSKLDKYRPAKVISNFKSADTLQYNEATTKLGVPYVKSVSVNGVETQLESKSISTSLKNTFIPGYQFKNQSFPFARDFAPDLISELKAQDIGPITRAKIASKIRQELDISLTAWIAGRFAGKSGDAADAELQRQETAASQGKQLSLFDDDGGDPKTAAENNTPETATGASSGIDDAAKDVATAQQETLYNESSAEATAANPNKTPDLVAKALDKDASAAAVSGLQGAIGRIISFINPVYKWGVPLCLIYDGSLQQSGPTIDEQSAQTERSAVWLQSAAAQAKDGGSVTAEAVGATDWKLGDITLSNAEKRANGEVVSTADYASTEASPTGQYTYSVADFIPGIGNVVDHLSPTVCSALTNTWVGLGLGVVNVGVALLSGGDASVAEGGGEAAVDGAVNTQLSLFDASTEGTTAASNSGSMLSRMLVKARSGGSIAKDFTKTTIKGVVGVGALTLMAKQLVAAEMGGSHSTLSTGQPFDQTVDCGTNIYANQIEQQQFYGAPMTDERLPADDTQNRAQLSEAASQQSAFERYLAVDNPDSLLSRTAMASSGYMNGSILKAPLKLGSALLNPVRSVASVFNPLISNSSFAAAPTTSANSYCGNIQFGFTAYEKQLIANDPTYKLLENQLYLDRSGQEDAIAARYGKCFDGSETIGTMLAKGDIRRDKNGDVIASLGLCSPSNLGTANHDTGYGPAGKGFNDLVFRWRVAMGYNNTLDQLNQEQDVSNDTTSTTSTPATTAGSATTLPTGSAQDLAKQLLPYISNGQLFCGPTAGSSGAANCPDIQNTAKGTPLGGNCAVDALTPHLLGLILGLVSTDGWKLGISAMCSDHHSEGDGAYAGHSYGSVADFSVQNSSSGAAAAADEKFVNDAAALLSSTGGSFGQIQCHPPYAALKNSKFTTFDDTCNHQHIRAAP
jgi:hypothetical protein